MSRTSVPAQLELHSETMPHPKQKQSLVVCSLVECLDSLPERQENKPKAGCVYTHHTSNLALRRQKQGHCCDFKGTCQNRERERGQEEGRRGETVDGPTNG